jgi:hypothetical protein
LLGSSKKEVIEKAIVEKELPAVGRDGGGSRLDLQLAAQK